MSTLLVKFIASGIISAALSLPLPPPGTNNLIIRVVGKSDASTPECSLDLSFNGATARPLYYWVWNETYGLQGDPGGVNQPAGGEGGEYRIRIGLFPGASGVVPHAQGFYTIEIPNYQLAGPIKVASFHGGLYSWPGPSPALKIKSISGFGAYAEVNDLTPASPITSVTLALENADMIGGPTVCRFVDTTIQIYAE